MKRLTTTFLLLASAALLSTSAVAQADHTPVHQKWLNEDVLYIITDAEKKAFTMLITDKERERFIEAFWRHRDPNPATAENEYRAEHYARIAYANQNFSLIGPGWRTDRGRIYIMYGQPDKVLSLPSGDSSTTSPLQVWIYNSLPGVGNSIRFEFIDATGKGDFRLRTSPLK